MFYEKIITLYPIQELDEYLALFKQTLRIQLSDLEACNKNGNL